MDIWKPVVFKIFSHWAVYNQRTGLVNCTGGLNLWTHNLGTEMISTSWYCSLLRLGQPASFVEHYQQHNNPGWFLRLSLFCSLQIPTILYVNPLILNVNSVDMISHYECQLKLTNNSMATCTIPSH